MAMYDPASKANEGSGGGGSTLPAGAILLVIRRVDNDDNDKGRQWKLRLECIHGPSRGAKGNVWINKPTTDFGARAQILIKALGIEKAFDDDNARETSKALCHRPFKGRIELEEKNGYMNPRLTRIEKTTPSDLVIIDTWMAEEEERRALRGSATAHEDSPQGEEDELAPRGGTLDNDDDPIPF